MGVVYIGDRAVGKTHFALELANPQGQYVRVSMVGQTYQNLKANLLDSDGTAKQTNNIEKRPLNVQVRLPSGLSEIPVDWIDSPGEIFRRSWQSEHPLEWDSFQEVVRQSEGVLLILQPYREILRPELDATNFVTQEQWCHRFERWARFFCYDCPKVKHIVICLNKADLINCKLSQESEWLAYRPDGSSIKWLQRHNHVVNSYFRLVKSQIELINRTRPGLSVRCFITSIYDRSLLELPWLYLASYFAN
ncbi:MAG: hypothetical protein SXA11_03235 [Cyanobacteriota bacterium]|nr:hypothetical protein [Cyanobacteriota bacterium]